MMTKMRISHDWIWELCFLFFSFFFVQDIRGPQAHRKAVRGEECEEEDDEDDAELVGGMTMVESDSSDEEEEEENKGRGEVNGRKRKGKPEWDSSCGTY